MISRKKASIYDLRKDASREAIDAEVEDMKISWLNSVLTKWTFRLMLLRSAYSNDELRRMVKQSHFRQGEILPDGIGFELRLAK